MEAFYREEKPAGQIEGGKPPGRSNEQCKHSRLFDRRRTYTINMRGRTDLVCTLTHEWISPGKWQLRGSLSHPKLCQVRNHETGVHHISADRFMLEQLGGQAV
jgi:hypothetical protein